MKIHFNYTLVDIKNGIGVSECVATLEEVKAAITNCPNMKVEHVSVELDLTELFK